jgi:glycosyltransferase involved in cell wall biosynthesis
MMVLMPESALEISVCLCTYKRPDKLSDCLMSLVKQTFSRPFEVIVTDNDCHRSGEKIVHEFKETFQIRGIPISYLVEPVQNISLARNRCVQAAQGNLVAFIDDDERASPYWLETLYQILLETDADGVWGPVIPDIPESFPEWMRRGKLFDRPIHKDRSDMPEGGMAT